MTDFRGFVRAHTRLSPVPLVPEILLHQADEAIALWERTENESATRQPPPFWAFAWAGGQALARHVLDHPALVAGREVLDLAAGSGLVAIAAAKAGAAAVTAVDIDPLSLAAVAANAAANGVTVAAVERDILDTTPDAAVVLAGDVFYSRAMAERMMAYFQRAAAAGALVMVGDPGRAYLPPSGLRRVAAYAVPVVATLEDAEIKQTTVWQVTLDQAIGPGATPGVARDGGR
ncbi:50S ribosomal protein L11 methyltransferase [Phytohabitans sp. ZYX-F-186]|uniref:50S ribosomal protein L11 methyltransferase n=1 Tax=Phytohabitans maris TaxID=3071409 RepID=A0ABU0ZHY6_9ACTN|nr:50S ribosomal protein L11 methyltransferase [Phytohabitans sp. ZYX-F-186]MDQ7906610.1 50S ribosomal protein L11 methyltransferase [Phytohabitans sp. ZYX-F-186]